MRPWRPSWAQAQMVLFLRFYHAEVTLSVPLACPPYTALDNGFLSSGSHQGPSGLNWWLILHMTVFQFHFHPAEQIFRRGEVMYSMSRAVAQEQSREKLKFFIKSESVYGAMEESGRRWKSIRAPLLSEAEKELKIPKYRQSCVFNNICENLWGSVSPLLALSHMEYCCTLQKQSPPEIPCYTLHVDLFTM